MGAPLPLLDRAAGDTLFCGPGGAVTATAFLTEVQALARRLPAGGRVVNLCRDRLAFAVAFAAALVRGCPCLLNMEPAQGAGEPGLLALAEPGVATGPLPCIRVVTGQVAPDPAAPNPAIPGGQLAAIVFTSGSTGQPVPHEKRWAELVARSRAAAERFGLTGGSLVGMVPPQHMYGFETTVLLPLHAPVCSWCGPAFFPADVAAALRHGPAPRWLVTTPLQLRTLLQDPLPQPPDAAISATAPLDPVLAEAAEAAWGAAVHEIFGATECGSIASRRTRAGPEWQPYPGVRVVATPQGAVAHVPEGPPVLLADVIEAGAEGFRLLGRRADLVKMGGRRASLARLNQVLTGLPGVDDGAFVVPDDLDRRSTARLVAVVVAPQRSPDAILADLRERLDPLFLPRRVIRVERMPRNALGKLPRQALLALLGPAPGPAGGA